jgi:hypothetical protein
MPIVLANLLISLFLLSGEKCQAGDFGVELAGYQNKLRQAGEDMLENLEVSYVYGGSKVGDGKTCDECNRCLEDRHPSPKERFKVCKICSGCSLDCSHFVQLVFAKAGLGFPYITSTQMLEFDSESLSKKFGLRPISRTIDGLIAGDLLVYRGHVVIVEKVHADDSVDIIHATGGKDIRLPGQGIQRERFVRVTAFRGELQRVLRHLSIDRLWREIQGQKPPEASSSRAVQSATSDSRQGRFKLRRVEKRRID